MLIRSIRRLPMCERVLFLVEEHAFNAVLTIHDKTTKSSVVPTSIVESHLAIIILTNSS